MGEGSTNYVHGFGKNYDSIFGKEKVVKEAPLVKVKKSKKPKDPNAPAKTRKMQKPVTILLTPEMRGDAEVQRQCAGHVILYTDELPVKPDMVLGAKAWRILPPLYPYIKIAIKEARLEKYGKSAGDGAAVASGASVDGSATPLAK